MKLNPLKIGNIIAKIPIIQGGMGIGVSGYRLASAVANENAIGIISAAQIGYKEPDFKVNPQKANIRALKSEIKKAREISPKGIIGVNVMVAMTQYDEMIKVALEEDVDLIISGAGLPMNLPKLIEGHDIKIAPIVSSRKAVSIILRSWAKKYNRYPDFIVIEGPKAGGHLGFNKDKLSNKEDISLEKILQDVIDEVNKYNKDIPIIAAGGIYDKEDIKRFLNLGASGVQMATRFIATEECDAHINFKNAFINCYKEDITLVKSPVGLPGRAIRNNFLNLVNNIENLKPNICYNCIKFCDPGKTPYCISDALINAVNGHVDDGLIFTGSNGYRINKIITVKELIKELIE
ncbi:NAD(P)H-dependent flavin oxidoreductase [Clostridium niameyense]|uniref:NAD(P)H-dependent flavin oxidoreductase n=1 Tax=Clostridium niameyense TaxID=1622073 RepID=UPI00067F229B|nr:nitronate monooxygenase family protein [Clostridium niameyense]